MNVFIFHGTMGNPEGNWFPWLKRQLINQGIKVYVPRFPTPEGQSLDNWLKVFEPYQKQVNQDSVFVGHSMGPGFMLRLLEKRKTPILGAILVSPFDSFIGIEPYDTLNKSFIDHPFDFVKIKQNCQKFVVMTGDDDPYIPSKQPTNIRDGLYKMMINEGKKLAEKLNVDFHLIHKGGHLNAETNYFEFPEVLVEINRLLFSGKKEKWLLAKQKN